MTRVGICVAAVLMLSSTVLAEQNAARKALQEFGDFSVLRGAKEIGVEGIAGEVRP